MPGIQDGSEDFICLSSGILQQKPSAKAVFNRKASEHFRATEQGFPKKKSCKISELVRMIRTPGNVGTMLSFLDAVVLEPGTCTADRSRKHIPSLESPPRGATTCHRGIYIDL
jgi:hypothetical protein